MQRMYEILIKLKDEVSGSLKNIENNATKMEKNLKSGTEGMSRSFMGLKTSTMAVFASITAVAYSLKKFTDAAIEAQYVDAKLLSTMKKRGLYTKEGYKDLLDYATALSFATATTDEQIKTNMKLSMSLGVIGENIKWVTTRAIDMAKEYEARGIDATAATNLLSKALQGNIERLGMYIPE